MSREIQTLRNAIRRRLDKDQRRDVARYGASSGFPGFCYYTETSRFYRRHRHAVWELLEEDADAQGTTPLQVVAQLGGQEHVNCVLSFENLLAWYALERVCADEVRDEEMR